MFSGPGALQNRSGTCLNASGVFFASNLHVEMSKTIAQAMRSKHFWIFTMFGGSLASPLGRIHVRKNLKQIDTGDGINEETLWCSGASQVTKNVLGTKQVQKNDLWLIFGVPGSKWRCASFSFQREFRVCEELVAIRIYRFLLIQNELSQDKFGRCTTSQSNS